MTRREKVFRRDRLLKILEANKMKQEEFADLLGMAQPQFNRYINDGAEPTGALVVRMATKLNITTDYLFGLSDDPNKVIKPTDLSGEVKEFDDGLSNKDSKTAIDLLSKKP